MTHYKISNVLRKMSVFIILFFVVQNGYSAENVGLFQPRLKVIDVINMSREFLQTKKINADRDRLSSISYNYISRIWFVSYETSSLAIGEGSYSVRISDVDGSDIELFKGL